MIQVDESVTVEQVGKKQNDFLNWLQTKLEEEMQKPTYKDYMDSEKSKPRKKKKKTF